MKIAYCIIAHKSTKVLHTAISILSQNNHVYLHIDKKSDITNFPVTSYNENVTVLNHRINTKWGDFSQVLTTLELMKAVRNKKYQYVFLLSGDCLPVRKTDEIERFLMDNQGKQFIALDQSKGYSERVRYKYPLNSIFYKRDKTIVEKIITQIRIRLGLLKKNPEYHKLPQLYKGTNWFTITGELNEFILNYLDENPWYLNAFRESLCSDEVFFHTIIFNSKYKKDIYQLNNESTIPFKALRYIDWETGPEYPRVLNSSDFKKIKQTNCLFARKFDDKLDFEEYYQEFIYRER